MKRSFLEEFKARQFFHQCTNEEALADKVSAKDSVVGAYIGFDCTATSLHVGSLMQLMIFRLMQRHGIKPIVLIGGGTSMIGDPSFKDKSRVMLTEEQIEINAAGIKNSISKFISFGTGASDAILVNNKDWLKALNYMEFLRDYGHHFSVNRMLSFDSVKLRLEREQNLSFLEFNYMILQAYDFLHLFTHNNCFIQCGGSDQWGNIVNGVELVRRTEGHEVFGLTTPLITTASGVKMGKTESGAIWLNEELLSPYDYYQFWRNTDDRDVFKFMRMYTDMDIEQISKYENDTSTNINEYKKMLAYQATEIAHGKDSAVMAAKTAIEVFEKGDMQNVEKYTIDKSEVESGMSICALFTKCGLTSSNGEAKRLVNAGGAKLNGEKITDESHRISLANFTDSAIVLSSGKKRHVRVEL